ncbi:MAG TPA: hypothetical protein VNW30_08225 [Opitutaceae bacterium]|jgi:FMN phosphatase YigB (HAD superfamily)|nr:hypothetical protein [Opitutaceae bacterium]
MTLPPRNNLEPALPSGSPFSAGGASDRLDSKDRQPASPIESNGPIGARFTSFDVFGTCLVRAVGPPSELFRLVGRMVGERLGTPRPEQFAEDFIEWRSEAERRARRRSMREEVRLQEIWLVLQAMLGPERCAALDGPTLELEAERSVLRPIIAARERILLERTRGNTILFISDTYLPGSFLIPLLRDFGLAAETDRVYLSSEVGLTKRSGSLFRHVLAAEQLPAPGLYHIGDNDVADAAVPRRLGIQTELFTASSPKTVERHLLWLRPPVDALWLRTAGAMATTRLSRPTRDSTATALEKFVSQFLGPFSCVFGHWVLRKAAEEGVTRLYFASRDARLQWQACRILAASDKRNLDLRYLYISRKAVMIPSISEVSAAGIPWLRRDLESPTLPRLLAKLDLDDDDFTAQWMRLNPGWKPDRPLESALEWTRFWKLLGSPQMSARIMDYVALRRRNAHAYFTSVGLLDAVPTGFVDLGWRLTCQAGINQIRRDSPNLPPLRGYYLALKRFRLGPAEAGEASAIFRESADDLPASPHLDWLRRSYLLDHIIGFADHPSVLAYGDQGRVEFVPSPQTAAAGHFHAIETTLADYVTTYGPSWEAIAHDDAQLQIFLSTLLNQLFQEPSRSCLHILRDISFSSKPGCVDAQSLMEPYGWPEILGSFLPRWLFGGRWPDARFWPEASAAITSRPGRAALATAHGIRRLVRKMRQ